MKIRWISLKGKLKIKESCVFPEGSELDAFAFLINKMRDSYVDRVELIADKTDRWFPTLEDHKKWLESEYDDSLSL